MGKAAKQQGNMTKAVAYLRVSTDDQNLGPQAQFVAIQRFASSKGIEIVAVHEDHGVSGGAQLVLRAGSNELAVSVSEARKRYASCLSPIVGD